MGRAPALAIDDRRAMIIECVIPLLLEHGRDVTSRQIAEAAGIAEGTVFRAFGDKETLIHAAASAFLEGTGAMGLDAAIDPELALEEKLRILVDGMRHRVRDVMRMASIAGTRGPAVAEAQRLQFNAMVATLLDRERDLLSVDVNDLGDYLRMFAIASSLPLGARQFSTDELVALLQFGLLGAPSTKD